MKLTSCYTSVDDSVLRCARDLNDLAQAERLDVMVAEDTRSLIHHVNSKALRQHYALVLAQVRRV